MRKTFWSTLALAAVLVCVATARAEDPKPAPADKGDGVEQRQEQRKTDFRAAIEKKDFDKALAVLEDMIADKDVLDEEKFMAAYFQFRILAGEKHDGAKACPIAKKLGETRKDDFQFLNELAWTILDTPEMKNRDLDLALSLAKQAAELTKHEDPSILDTLARAHFEKGDLDKAVEIQTLAVEKSNGNDQLPEEVKTQVKETLEKYKAEQAKPKK